MPGKGNGYDNAPIESFWGSLKNGMVHHHRFETRAQAESAIREYMGFFATANAGIHGLVIWLPLCSHRLSHGWPPETGLSTIVRLPHWRPCGDTWRVRGPKEKPRKVQRPDWPPPGLRPRRGIRYRMRGPATQESPARPCQRAFPGRRNRRWRVVLPAERSTSSTGMSNGSESFTPYVRSAQALLPIGLFLQKNS